MTNVMKEQRAWQPALILSLLCTVTVACVQKPVVPSGAGRVPINSDEMISQYRERVKNEQREKQERSVLTRQIETLTKQVEELAAAVTLVQLHQQEAMKGTSRHGQRHIVTATPTGLSLAERSGPPTSAAPLPQGNDGPPVESAQPSSPPDASKRGQGEEGQPTPVGSAACAVKAPIGTARSSSRGDESHRESWTPRVITLSKREQVELHRHSVIFRVSERTGRSEFLPSKGLQSHLKRAMKLGHCLEVRGYTDGDKDRWIERETATQRALKARAYLLQTGCAPNNIRVTIVPVGDHVADNTTTHGRAKNRRVEIEVRGNPASVWPQWYG